ncbi:MAG: zinc ribbon domain-containing protein [Methanosarcinaceae archaeon]|nr:zinc ribbon domain-containing protein [Methanosarcinaceae archaeon]
MSSFVAKLEYKAKGYGKTLLRIGPFKPSSKICNVCGFHNFHIKFQNLKKK